MVLVKIGLHFRPFFLLTVVRCLSLCGYFPDSWPEKSIGHCIIFYHALLSCSSELVTNLPVYGYLSSVGNDSEAAETAIHTKYLSN